MRWCLSPGDQTTSDSPGTCPQGTPEGYNPDRQNQVEEKVHQGEASSPLHSDSPASACPLTSTSPDLSQAGFTLAAAALALPSTLASFLPPRLCKWASSASWQLTYSLSLFRSYETSRLFPFISLPALSLQL